MLLTLHKGNSLINGGFPHKEPVMRSFDVTFVVSLKAANGLMHLCKRELKFSHHLECRIFVLSSYLWRSVNFQWYAFCGIYNSICTSVYHCFFHERDQYVLHNGMHKWSHTIGTGTLSRWTSMAGCNHCVLNLIYNASGSISDDHLSNYRLECAFGITLEQMTINVLLGNVNQR